MDKEQGDDKDNIGTGIFIGYNIKKHPFLNIKPLNIRLVIMNYLDSLHMND